VPTGDPLDPGALLGALWLKPRLMVDLMLVLVAPGLNPRVLIGPALKPPLLLGTDLGVLYPDWLLVIDP